jgi:hypothetical protein
MIGLTLLKDIINLEGEYRQAFVTMGESGIGWIDVIFRFCVIVLVDSAKVIGVTYEELNVWLFAIILPTVIMISLMLNVFLTVKLYSARKSLKTLGAS